MTTKQLEQGKELLHKIDFEKGKLNEYKMASADLLENKDDFFYLDVARTCIDIPNNKLASFFDLLANETQEEIDKLNDKFKEI